MTQERIDWILYMFHMAGIQDLHKDILNTDCLLHADHFVTNEVSIPTIKGVI